MTGGRISIDVDLLKKTMLDKGLRAQGLCDLIKEKCPEGRGVSISCVYYALRSGLVSERTLDFIVDVLDLDKSLLKLRNGVLFSEKKFLESGASEEFSLRVETIADQFNVLIHSENENLQNSLIFMTDKETLDAELKVVFARHVQQRLTASQINKLSDMLESNPNSAVE